MKKIGLFLAMACFGIAAFAQPSTYLIKGRLKGKEEGKLYMTYFDENNNLKKDSATVVGGAFEFKGDLVGPRTIFLKNTTDYGKINSTNNVEMFIEPGMMELELTEGNYSNFKLSGSPMQDDNYRLMAAKQSIFDEIKPLQAAFEKANAAYIQSVKAKAPEATQDSLRIETDKWNNQIKKYRGRLNQVDEAFFAQNPNSYVTAYYLASMASEMPIDKLEKIYNTLSPKVQQSSYAKRIVKEMDKRRKGAPGAMAIAFAALDLNGKELSLAHFKGKYVLLDFWASWCGPCRAGNPHLKKLYAQYQAKGFEIIGVSDDDDKPEAWRKAIKQDGIGIWKHILRGAKKTKDGVDHSADVNESYAVHVLPTKILIDKEGKIIGRYGGGGEDDEAMDKKLAQIFGK